MDTLMADTWVAGDVHDGAYMPEVVKDMRLVACIIYCKITKKLPKAW